MLNPRLKKVLSMVGINLCLIVISLVIIELTLGDWVKHRGLSHLGILRDRVLVFNVIDQKTGEKRIVHNKIDSYGFRGPYSSVDKIDILTVGGSTTAQRYLDDGETWQDFLSEALKKKGLSGEIANAGQDGQGMMGHGNNLHKWFPLVPKLAPKFIIFYVGVNDFFYGEFGERKDGFRSEPNPKMYPIAKEEKSTPPGEQPKTLVAAAKPPQTPPTRAEPQKAAPPTPPKQEAPPPSAKQEAAPPASQQVAQQPPQQEVAQAAKPDEPSARSWSLPKNFEDLRRVFISDRLWTWLTLPDYSATAASELSCDSLRCLIYSNSATVRFIRQLQKEFLARTNGTFFQDKAAPAPNQNWVTEPLQLSHRSMLDAHMPMFLYRMGEIINKTKEMNAIPIFVSQRTFHWVREGNQIRGTQDVALRRFNVDYNGVDMYHFFNIIASEIKAQCAHLKIPYFDMLSEVDFVAEDFSDPVHNSKAGAKKIGYYLADKLEALMKDSSKSSSVVPEKGTQREL